MAHKRVKLSQRWKYVLGQKLAEFASNKGSREICCACSAATMDEEGNVWLATEWSGGHVDPLCAKLYSYGRCPNWSTYVMQLSKKRTAIVQKSFPTTFPTS